MPSHCWLAPASSGNIFSNRSPRPPCRRTGPRFAGEGRSAIGWVVVGGMTIGTLFVIPVAYTYIAGERHTVEVAPGTH